MREVPAADRAAVTLARLPEANFHADDPHFPARDARLAARRGEYRAARVGAIRGDVAAGGCADAAPAPGVRRRIRGDEIDQRLSVMGPKTRNGGRACAAAGFAIRHQCQHGGKRSRLHFIVVVKQKHISGAQLSRRLNSRGHAQR